MQCRHDTHEISNDSEQLQHRDARQNVTKEDAKEDAQNKKK
jgi:hypothetical protein